MRADAARARASRTSQRCFTRQGGAHGRLRVMRALEKHVMLPVLDKHWREHLAGMDYLRQGIHLRGYAQKQPKQEFKREAFELFAAMLERDQARNHPAARARAHPQRGRSAGAGGAAAAPGAGAPAAVPARRSRRPAAPASRSRGAEPARCRSPQTPVQRDAPKVGRNDPCPCGSGKKYKHCHGQLA